MNEVVAAFERMARAIEAMTADLPEQIERESGLANVRIESIPAQYPFDGGARASGMRPDGTILAVDGQYWGLLDAAAALVQARATEVETGSGLNRLSPE